jgi:hypothetical protein
MTGRHQDRQAPKARQCEEKIADYTIPLIKLAG